MKLPETSVLFEVKLGHGHNGDFVEAAVKTSLKESPGKTLALTKEEEKEAKSCGMWTTS